MVYTHKNGKTIGDGLLLGNGSNCGLMIDDNTMDIKY